MPKPERDSRYLTFIRTLPCCCGCGRFPCEAAHTGRDGGMSMKASDYTAVPLFWECHREQHRIGIPAFERTRGINFSQLWPLYRASYKRRVASR